MRQSEATSPQAVGKATQRGSLVSGGRWMLERWPRFGLYFGVAMTGWLVLGIVPWWTALLVVVVDAGWSARRDDWSLVAFLAWSAVVVTAVAVVVPLLV